MKFLALLTILFMIAGCKRSGVKDLPPGLVNDSIIPRSEMINILADVHIVEATLQVLRNKNIDPSPLENFYYSKLFSRYKVSKGKFELNLNYYEMDPENLRKMYEEVEKKLEALQKQKQ
jgi:hypothetical protein